MELHRSALWLRSSTALSLAVAATLCGPAIATGTPQPKPWPGFDTIRRQAAESPLACTPGLARGADGLASGSPLIGQISGAASGTTGGLGHPVLTVTTAEEGKPRKAPAGSLRWAVERAAASGGAWIQFDPSLKGSRIRLEHTLDVPSNTTIDGGCGGVEVYGPPRITLMTLTGADNVIISGLSFTKEDYDDKLDKTGDALGLTDELGRIAILHNAFRRCGDGCVDIVRKDRFASTSRVTVAFNRFSHHNKVMLIGTLTCYKDKVAAGCDAPLDRLKDELEPKVEVTVLGNVFEQTSQRHPKVVSNAKVRLVNNVMEFAATPYSSGEDSAVYGAAAGTGGLLWAEGNIFADSAGEDRIGAGPITVVRSATGGGTERDGAVKVRDNAGLGGVGVAENRPDLVENAAFAPVAGLPLASHPPASLAACLYLFAGPQGASARWPDVCAAP
jgi:pectate lyase